MGPAERTLRMVSARLARALAETLDGQRRLIQLENWFDPDSLEALDAARTRLAGHSVRLASLRVQPHTTGSAEVTLRLATPQASHAAALRVSRHGQTWIGSGLVLG